MIKIILLSIGALKENDLKSAVKEYQKRLQAYCRFEIIEIAAGYHKNKEVTLLRQGQEILSKIPSKAFAVCFTPEGKEVTSEEFSQSLQKWSVIGQSKIYFIIGGADGLHMTVKKRANALISFSKLTFPHQLFKVMVLEQIYRGFTICHHQKYHK